MEIKYVLRIGLRVATIGYILFALFYGIIIVSVDLTQTINFKDAAAAAAAQREQLFIGIPYILLGTILLALLIIFYALKNRRKNMAVLRRFGIVVAAVGASLSLAFVGIAIYISENSLVLCIIPALCLFIYGTITARKKNMESLLDN